MADPLLNPGYVNPEALLCLGRFIGEIKHRMVDLLGIEAGMSVLDVGCGPGTDTVNLARSVGREGRVVGLDYDQSMIRDAHDRALKAGVDTWTWHLAGNALALPCHSNLFDACQSDRLFQHVENCPGVLGEMIRVTKPGGKIVVADADWCSLSIDTTENALERRITRFLPDLLHNGYAGRQLFRLFQEHNLSEISVEVHPLVWTDWRLFRATSFSMADLEQRIIESGIVTQRELEVFFGCLEEAHRQGRFFASANMMLTAGVKPRK